jgi:GlcNAc-P-P-Und epimerase
MIQIIGGSGFIGSRLCERLSKKEITFQILDKVISTSFTRESVLVDVRSVKLLQATIKQESVLINLAAEHRDDVFPLSLYDDVNVQGAKNICLVANQKNIRTIIFTSSVAVYGFSPLGTDEFGKIAPFNDYGRTKWKAEQVYKAWQAVDPKNRTLVIIRPTVVFGERNRGNVFNLLKQIASGKFVMVSNGLNRKSMAYVENVAAFLEYSMSFKPGVHLYNYLDKPDFSMNDLVNHVNKLLGRSSEIKFRLPYMFGLIIGNIFDLAAKVLDRKFPISSIRVKKFCANSVYESAISQTGFVPPVKLMDAIEKTVSYEFIESHVDEKVFYSE